MPDRFMVGTDAKFGRADKFSTFRYLEEIEKTRRLLGTLDPEAAKKTAYTNARDLLAAR